MNRILSALLCTVVAATLALAPVAAGAEEKAPERRGNRKVLRLDAITVEGKFQKPEAFYILQRANLELDELEKAESFLPKIVKSQENEVF